MTDPTENDPTDAASTDAASTHSASTRTAPARTAQTHAALTLDPLPDTARLWVFGSSRPLTPTEETRLLTEVEDFLGQWKAHGDELAAAHEWRYGRFLLVAVDDRVAAPSGCSIDALVRRLRELERELEVSLVGSAPVWYRDGDEIQRVSRPEFKVRAQAGEITPETVVYDLSVTRLGQLRNGEWETRAGRSWHARYLSET